MASGQGEDRDQDQYFNFETDRYQASGLQVEGETEILASRPRPRLTGPRPALSRQTSVWRPVCAVDRSINQSIKWVLGRSLIVGHRASLGRRLIGISRNGRRQTDRRTDGRTDRASNRSSEADARRRPAHSNVQLPSGNNVQPSAFIAGVNIRPDRH